MTGRGRAVAGELGTLAREEPGSFLHLLGLLVFYLPVICIGAFLYALSNGRGDE